MTDKQWKSYVERTSHLLRRYSCTEEQQRAMSEIVEKLPDKAVVIELGTSYGLTAGFFLVSGEKNRIEYHGVDDFSLESKYDKVKENLDALNISYFLHPVKTQVFAQEWNRPIDFLFIDAGHDEVNARHDIETFIPLVKSGGYVAFHDWDDCDDSNLTPHWAVTYYGRRATSDWEEIAFIGNQLMIRRKP